MIRRRVLSGSLAGAIALSLAVSAHAPRPAHAAGSIGPWRTALIYCDPARDQIQVTPQFGASDSFTSQWLYYEIGLWQATGGWASVNPAPAKLLEHKRVTTFQDPYSGYWYTQAVANGLASVDTWTFTLTPGSYAIKAFYWWWDGAQWQGPLGDWSQWRVYQDQGVGGATGSFDTYWCDLSFA